MEEDGVPITATRGSLSERPVCVLFLLLQGGPQCGVTGVVHVRHLEEVVGESS